jgi:hypothetical protein
MGSVALASASQAATVTFNYTGADVSYTINPGTYRITVYGAQGGGANCSGQCDGGLGAEASAIYKIGQPDTMARNRSAQKASALSRDPHRQFGDPVDEGREQPLRLADDLDSGQAIEDFLPKNLQLHFGQALTHAAVNAEAERLVLA